MMSAHKKESDYIFSIFQESFKAINFKYNTSALRKYVDWNSPDFNLLSIKNIFRHFGVSSVGVQLPPKLLSEIPLPAIAHISDEEDDFVLIKSVKQNVIEYGNRFARNNKEPIAEFVKRWSGAILLIDSPRHREDFQYHKNQLNEWVNRILVAIILIAFIVLSLSPLFLLGLKNKAYIIVLSALCNFIGILVSAMIISESTRKGNSLFCTEDGACDMLARSKYSRFFGIIPLSGASLCYFTFKTILTIILTLFNYSIVVNVIFLFSLFSLPVIAYSFYIQAVIFRRFCRLCLAICTLLLVDTAILWTKDFVEVLSAIHNLSLYLLIIFSFLLSIIFSIVLSRYFNVSVESDRLGKVLYGIYKKNLYSNIFFKDEHDAPELFPGMVTVNLGNPSSITDVTVVISTACHWCKDAFDLMERIASERDDILIRFVILSNSTFAYNLVNEILESVNPPLRLKEWFSCQLAANEPKWADKISKDTKVTSSKADMHNQWIDIADIKRTPTYFVNNRELDKDVSISDFLYLNIVS